MGYARKLTKEDLIADGITEITKEGRVFKGEKEVFPHWSPNKSTGDYLSIIICERDPEGHLIKGKERICKYTKKDGTISEHLSWTAKFRTIGLHRAMWAWHYGEVPEGMVVDHKDNQHSTLHDYRLENLQILTPQQNLEKEKGVSTKQVKCMLNKPRSFYEDKVAKYEALYEEAKANKDAYAAHKQRANLAQARARLRYWDSHKVEYDTYLEQAKEKEANDILLAEEKADRKIKNECKKKLRAIATKYRDCGDKFHWRQFLNLLKHFDELPLEKLEEIADKTITKLQI